MGPEKTILIVHNYYQIPGGEDTVVANESEMLKRHGHKVILYSRNNSELNEMTKLQKLMLPVTTIFNFKTYFDIKKLIKDQKVDIVHVHNTLNLISPSVYYAARKKKVPVFQTVHNFRLICPGATLYRDGHICEDCINNGLHCAVKHNCYRNSKLQTLACVVSTTIHRMTGIYGKIKYICLTEFNKDKLLTFKQINSDQVFVKPNFADCINGYVPDSDRENQFVFAGRLDKLKGIDILFKAWYKMGVTAPTLIVCGKGPEESWCREFLKDNPCNIEIKGFVNNEKVRELIAISRGLILPTQWYEGFPMSIIEAFSAGTPVVCSDLGNAGSLIDEGMSGCKFKNDSIDELINAVNRCENLCDSTFDKYKEKYTEQINYSQLVGIYE